jgi:SAM-dependent methyltransferase
MHSAARLLPTVKRRLGRPYREALRRLGHAVFEHGLQSTERSDVSSGHLFLYRALLGSRVTGADAFLDYGSGKGRVLLHAARLPFGRVIGVDLDEEASAVARANAALAASKRRCERIEVLTADATVWQVPDDVMFIYMYNPFWGEVFDSMLDRVTDSLLRRPRPLKILYAYPTCADRLLATGRFRLLRTSRGLRRDRPQHRIDVFEALDRRAAAEA